MKVAIINDQHLGARNDSSVVHDYFEKFYRECFFPRIDKENVQAILSLGDIFDRRKYVNFDTLCRSKQYWFDQVEKRNIESHYIVGNHDVYYKNTNRVNSPALLLQDYQLNVYEEPTEIEFDGVTFLLLPWINKENEQLTMDAIENSNAQFVGAHLELQGFEMYRGAVSESGLSHKVFSKFDAVFTGHYHHKSSKDNIHYLGAPYEIIWSDYNDPRGFHLFDTETRELTFVRNPFRLFHKIFYNDEKLCETELDQLDYSKINDGYVKVVVQEKNNPYLFDLFIDRVNSFDPVNLQVVEDVAQLNLDSEDDIIDEAEDTITIIRKCISGLELENTQEVETLFYELYSDALSE